MEPLFVVSKIIGSPCKNVSLFFHSKIVLSVIMTIIVLLRLATHEQLCDVRVLRLQIRYLNAVANLGVILIFSELCC